MMTLTILSTQSEAIKKYVKERMQREAEELGFDPYGDTNSKPLKVRSGNWSSKALTILRSTGRLSIGNWRDTDDSHEKRNTIRRKVLQGLNWDPRTGSQ